MPNMKTQKSQEHYVLRSNEGEERYHPNVFHSEWFKSGEQGERAPGTPKDFPRNTQGKIIS